MEMGVRMHRPADSHDAPTGRQLAPEHADAGAPRAAGPSISTLDAGGDSVAQRTPPWLPSAQRLAPRRPPASLVPSAVSSLQRSKRRNANASRAVSRAAEPHAPRPSPTSDQSLWRGTAARVRSGRWPARRGYGGGTMTAGHPASPASSWRSPAGPRPRPRRSSTSSSSTPRHPHSPPTSPSPW